MSKIGFVFPQKECVDEVKSALRGSEVEILVASDMTGNGIEAAKAMVDAGSWRVDLFLRFLLGLMSLQKLQRK